MGFNTSKKVCIRNLKILRRLKEEQRTFSVAAKDVKKRAYEIREAMEAVKHHAEFAEFARLGSLYTIKTNVEKKRLVFHWRYKDKSDLTDAEVDFLIAQQPQKKKNFFREGEVAKEEIASVSVTPEKESRAVPEVRTFLEIISSVAALEAENDELFFPEAVFEESEKKKLFDWSKERNWQYIDHEGAGITLTRREIDSFLLWEPEDEPSSL